MTKSTITLFELTANSDSIEGRGHTESVAFMESLEEAKKAVDDPRWAKFCVMGVHRPGRHYYDIRKRHMNIYTTAEAFWNSHSEDAARQHALSKLTDKEKKLLGLLK